MPFTTAHPSLAEAIAQKGYLEATAVQSAVLKAPSDRDLLVSARTGSGKTVAFGLALANTLLGDQPTFKAPGKPLALLIAPTRELAMQVRAELAWLFAGTKARIGACVGGMDPRAERRALDAGVHIVVGTPGRLRDHMDRKVLNLSEIRAVVLDEADEMLDLGFRDEIEALLAATPSERRTLLFSATMPDAIRTLAARVQNDALRIEAGSQHEAHEDIEYRVMLVPPREREHVVVNLLRMTDSSRALVFCATRDGVGLLHRNLVERGFDAVALSGELSQNERTRALQALRDGRARVCIATDVAARGLDLPDLGIVIHADPPTDAQVLRHRSGRTGRAGKKGVAVVLVPPRRVGFSQRMFQLAKIRPNMVRPPTADDVIARDQERLVAQIAEFAAAEPAADDLAVADKLLEGVEARTLVAALVATERRRLPAPEDLPETTANARSASRESSREPRESSRDSSTTSASPRSRESRPREDEPVVGVWFKVNVGRADEANARWLLPMLCRRGGVTKRVIGKITVEEHEARFEVHPAAADEFEAAASKVDKRNPGVAIMRVP